MIVAITGHRPGRLNGHEAEVSKWIIEQFKEYEPEMVYSGMAMGVDQLFALLANNFNIPLVCCYPFRRENYHPVENQIMDKAEEILFISEHYSKSSYYIRDKYMVDNCDVLLAVWDGIEKGGTWLTIDYARKKNKKIIYFPSDKLK